MGDSITIARKAIEHLGRVSQCTLVNQSSLYQSEPISDIPQDDYINAVVLIDTTLTPTALLLKLQAIEYVFYRQRDPTLRWAPRTLDLDIILFGHRVISDNHLTIPHGEIANRLFVLEPLFEISGEQLIPGFGSLKYLIDNAPSIQLTKVDN